MFQNMIMIMMIMTSILFIQMNHPLSMGLTLLIQTIMISIYLGTINDSYWFSYILFMVFIGGMLILFIYVTSLASNEMFSISINLKIFFLSIILLLVLFFYDDMIMNFFYPMQSTNPFQSMIKLFNYPNNLITILLMNYLLLTLIAIVKISNMTTGPLRQMN